MPDDHGFPMQLEVMEMPSRRLAGVPHQGPYPRISEAFLRLFPQADRLGLSQVAGAVYVAVYYDDPRTTSEDTLRSLAAVTVAENAIIDDLEERGSRPAGTSGRRSSGRTQTSEKPGVT